MERIVQRVINNRYVPFKPDILVEGTLLSFDCYIKRYANYVIIIEANTVLTHELLNKIKNHDVVYSHIHDSIQVKNYLTEHASANQEIFNSKGDTIRNALALPEAMASLPGDEQLQFAYKTISMLMKHIFENHVEKLPIDAFYSSSLAMVQLAEKDYAIPTLCAITPDEYSTHIHSTNVGFFSVFLASALGFSKDDLMNIAYAGLLHDIGKLKIDSTILLKADRLSEEEYEEVKNHSEYGYQILQNNGITNHSILNGVLHHHEKLDGSGYPKHLRGKMIPKYARIIGLCDVFDALTVRRTFRKNYTSYEALLMIKQEMGKQFDMEYINILIQKLR